MTKSEALFEEILSSLQIKFKKISEGDIQRPDYIVGEGDNISYWEIKEIVENQDEKNIINSIDSGNMDAYSVNSKRIKKRIKKAFHQF